MNTQVQSENLESIANPTAGRERYSKPVILVIDVKGKNNLHRLLQRCKVMPKEKKFTISPIVIGVAIRIAKIITSMEGGFIDRADTSGSSFSAIIKHTESVAQVIALSIQNGARRGPSKSLTKFILRNFSNEELSATLGITLQQVNMQDFVRSMVMAKGMSILQGKEN